VPWQWGNSTGVVDVYTNLSLKYIECAIDDLVKTLGIAEPIDPYEYLQLAKDEKYAECIKMIAKQYQLPASFRIKILPKGYRKNSQNFKTTGLSETDENGHGTDSIVAQVHMPANVPLFGSPKIRSLKIDVVIGKECCSYPGTFFYIMTHEVAHLLLETLKHPEKNNEIYADLVPLVLGFTRFAKIGRKVEKTTTNFDKSTTTVTTTYGYLTDEHFDVALEKLNSILNDYKSNVKKINNRMVAVDKKIRELNEDILVIRNLKEEVITNSKNRITAEDSQSLVRIYDTGYIDRFTVICNLSNTTMQKHEKHYKDLTYFNKKILNRINELDAETKVALQQLNDALTDAKKDVQVLENNLSFKSKLCKRLHI